MYDVQNTETDKFVTSNELLNVPVMSQDEFYE